jgi:hypothetical protein
MEGKLSFNSVGYLILTLAKIQSHCLIDQCKDPLINACEVLLQQSCDYNLLVETSQA